MPVAVEAQKVVYISVPKCACSSLKLFFHEVATGKTWREEKDETGTDDTVHGRYPSIPFAELDWDAFEGYDRIAVIRGPVDRLLSCYKDKVVNLRLLETDEARALLVEHNLPVAPDFDAFVTHLPIYREASEEIRRHSEPLSYWLGQDPTVFDALFHMRNLDRLVAWMANRGSAVPALRRANRSRKDVKARDLEPGTRKRVRALYEEDLDLFGTWLRQGQRPAKRSVGGQVN